MNHFRREGLAIQIIWQEPPVFLGSCTAFSDLLPFTTDGEEMEFQGMDELLRLLIFQQLSLRKIMSIAICIIIYQSINASA